ncbi:TPA: nickel/cobalt transporter [Proteus mirabilis]|nr:nickel/cobalt transporter [Proteus mirabilis]
MPINITKERGLLISLLTVIASCLLLIAYYWSELTYFNVQWQKVINSYLAELMQDISENNWQVGFILIGVSFLYGLLHAVGPRHGKVIISTYIATHPTKLKQSAWLSVLASLLQGTVAIVIITVILIILNLSSSHLKIASHYIENSSYLLISLSGIIIFIQSIRRLLSDYKKRAFYIKQATPIIKRSRYLYKHKSNQTISQTSCCGHKHVVTSNELQGNWSAQLLVLFAIGSRPCSGALLVLLFSYALNIYLWGIAAVIAMAIGTALTITAIALTVYYMRNVAYRFSVKNTNLSFRYMAELLRLLAGILFIFLGILMFNSAITLNREDIMPLFR